MTNALMTEAGFGFRHWGFEHSLVIGIWSLGLRCFPQSPGPHRRHDQQDRRGDVWPHWVDRPGVSVSEAADDGADRARETAQSLKQSHRDALLMAIGIATDER